MRTNTTSLFVLAVILALGLAACASEGDVIGATPPANTTVSAEPSTGQAIAGQAPTARDGSPTVIILEPRIQTDFPIPTDPVVLDQLGMAFLPPVLLAQVSQPVHFRNSEDVLHNVRVYNMVELYEKTMPSYSFKEYPGYKVRAHNREFELVNLFVGPVVERALEVSTIERE